MDFIKVKALTNGMLSPVAHAIPGQELAVRNEHSFKDRLSGFLTLIRPLFFMLTPVNAASAAVLALGGYPSLIQCLYGFVAVAFASCATNVFNDYIDQERDRFIWPDRPIPSGRVKPNEALLVVIISLVISLSIAWFLFNPPTFVILLAAIALGILYSTYLRNRVGYLSLPPLVGLIYLGGWAAFSPETLLSSWLPWYLYLLGVVWQTAHIMIYYPLHLITGTESDQKVPPVFFFTPSPANAVKIGISFTGVTLLLSILLPLFAPLSGFYLAFVIAAGTYALISGLRLLRDTSDRNTGIKAFTSLSIFRLVISAAILLSVFISQI